MENSKELTAKAARIVNVEKKYDEGKAILLQALELDPGNAKAHKGLAFCFLKEKNLDEAKEHLKTAIEIDKNYGEAHINLSLIYFIEKDYPKAIEHMDLAVDSGFPVDIRYRNNIQEFR